MANGHTRRSFIARVGAGAAAPGTGGLIAFPPSEAMAFCAGKTIACNTLYGFNGCAGGLCEDGSCCSGPSYEPCDWLQQNCNGGATRWRDCCIQWSQCSCTYPAGYPSCCNPCEWGQTCDPSAYTVRCRYHSCC
jgi:hypothetical protein